MRQPIRQRRRSKDWMVTYGLTTAFVIGSLWYLDLLPSLEQFQTQTTEVASPEQDLGNGGPLEEFLAESTEPEIVTEPEPVAPEQWEPEVTQTLPADAETPARTVSLSRTLPAAPQSGINSDQSAESATANVPVEQKPLSTEEQERIARLFGQPAAGQKSTGAAPFPTANETPESKIVPTSAEKPATPDFPLVNNKFAQVDQWIADGQYLQAHRALSEQYWKGEEDLKPLLERLNKTAGMIYFAPQPHFMVGYEIQQGDLLQEIAPQYNISWEYLARLNRVRPERVKVGQKLKVIKGPFSAFVDLSDFSLTIHAHGYFVKRYDIGIGADNSTPIGTFSVKEKLKNPTYYGPDGVVDADDPTNPLGERWIDIGDSYGIHGTIDPDSIKKAESRGCLRLGNEDIVEVYDFLTTGSEVVIRP